MKRLLICLTAFCLLALCIACKSGAALRDDTRLKTSIVVDGMNVSGMTVGEARASVEKLAEKRLNETYVAFSLGSDAVRFSLRQLGVSLDTESALRKAASLGKRGGERSIASAARIDRSLLESVVDAYILSRTRPPEDAYVCIDPKSPLPLSYVAEQDGVSIDRDALLSRVYAAAQNGAYATVAVPHTVEPAAKTVKSVLETQSLIASFQTSFDKSPYNAKNRVFNIKKAAAAVNGVVLQPNEEFDCNAVLGDRNAENGWKEAPGIRNGKYENEYGGGVCQLSSTLYNAALMADLTITERSPHSWPMGYVDIGRDAAISTGGKNLRFVNNTGAPLYLYVHVDEEAFVLTASLYGKPLENGMTISIESEHTGTIESAGEVYMLDESLPFQTRVVEREPRDGKTAVTYKLYHARDGSLLSREVVCKDTYRAIDGLTYVSTDLYYP